jgi:hypothetical protein
MASASLSRAACSTTSCEIHSGKATVRDRWAPLDVCSSCTEASASGPILSTRTYESGPKSPVDERELPLHEAKPDHVVRSRRLVQHAEDLIVLRVRPPAA